LQRLEFSGSLRDRFAFGANSPKVTGAFQNVKLFASQICGANKSHVFEPNADRKSKLVLAPKFETVQLVPTRGVAKKLGMFVEAGLRDVFRKEFAGRSSVKIANAIEADGLCYDQLAAGRLRLLNEAFDCS
jgi:hypothetical protein